MGYVRQTALADAYIADAKEDLASLPLSKMGSTCWVISEGIEYICNSKNKWLPRRKQIAVEDNPSGYYTKAEIDSQIKEVPKVALTHNEVLAITL